MPMILKLSATRIQSQSYSLAITHTEDLKNAVGLHSNGGLVVTFLVDDNHALVIAPQVGFDV